MLKHHLNVVCEDVWNRLDNSNKLGITQGEETLTDNILLYLASQNLSEIKIIQTPKYKEAEMGTDWEWWIGNAQDGYLRYAVQAKKLDLKTARYSSLNHKVGSGITARNQHDVLEDYARANKAIPLYVFYNYLEKKDYPKTWNCPQPIEHSKLGCTVTPLANVKKAISTRGCRTFQKIHDFPETVPLRCLAQCPQIICKSMDSSEHDIKKFGVRAKIYRDPWEWISEMGHLDSPKKMPSEFYNHDLGYYPKRILIIETGES